MLAGMPRDPADDRRLLEQAIAETLHHWWNAPDIGKYVLDRLLLRPYTDAFLRVMDDERDFTHHNCSAYVARASEEVP